MEQTPQTENRNYFHLNLHLHQKQGKNTALKLHKKIYENSQAAKLLSYIDSSSLNLPKLLASQ